MSNPTTRISSGSRPRTRVEFVATLVFCLSLALVYLVGRNPDSGIALRMAVSLLPFCVLLWGHWLGERRFEAANDELARRIRTESYAIAYPITLGIVMLLGMLHSLGLGLLPPEVYWAAGALGHFIGREIARRRYQ